MQKGYQISFFTEQSRRKDGRPMGELDSRNREESRDSGGNPFPGCGRLWPGRMA